MLILHSERGLHTFVVLGNRTEGLPIRKSDILNLNSPTSNPKPKGLSLNP